MSSTKDYPLDDINQLTNFPPLYQGNDRPSQEENQESSNDDDQESNVDDHNSQELELEEPSSDDDASVSTDEEQANQDVDDDETDSFVGTFVQLLESCQVAAQKSKKDGREKFLNILGLEISPEKQKKSDIELRNKLVDELIENLSEWGPRQNLLVLYLRWAKKTVNSFQSDSLSVINCLITRYGHIFKTPQQIMEARTLQYIGLRFDNENHRKTKPKNKRHFTQKTSDFYVESLPDLRVKKSHLDNCFAVSSLDHEKRGPR